METGEKSKTVNELATLDVVHRFRSMQMAVDWKRMRQRELYMQEGEAKDTGDSNRSWDVEEHDVRASMYVARRFCPMPNTMNWD
jgi:hypothetical protein